MLSRLINLPLLVAVGYQLETEEEVAIKMVSRRVPKCGCLEGCRGYILHTIASDEVVRSIELRYPAFSSLYDLLDFLAKICTLIYIDWYYLADNGMKFAATCVVRLV